MLTRILLIGFAGALGTLTRYFVGLGAGKLLGTGYPYGTLIVNIVGCFLIAVVTHVAVTTAVSPTLRLTLTTGFMGGLTTYSSFNLETTGFFRERDLATGFLNVGLTLFLCFGAGLLGLATARRFVGP
jgi:fluoride exporter